MPGVFLALTGLIVSIFQPVLAQAGARASLTVPDTSRFPTISFFLDAYDASGNFLSGLKAGDIQVLENGAQRPLTAVDTVEPGLQVMIAFNTGAFMANRTGGENTLFQRIQSQLQAWAKTQSTASQDDYTLLSNEGVVSIHRSEASRLSEDIAGYQPDLARGRPSLSSLSQALDITSDPLSHPNMKRALLYITTLPPDNGISALPNLAQRAAKMGVRISVWLTAAGGSEDTKGGQALRALAEDTGGEFFLYTGNESLPNPEAYFKSLRSLYQLTYNSGVQKSGEQSLSVRIEHFGAEIATPAQTFRLDVQPPNPMFIDPPIQVNRTLLEQTGNTETPAVLQPDSVPVKILIEFPDGHKRPLKSAKLYVDGTLAEELTSEPFDRFDWSLTEEISSRHHLLQVKIEDTLGLVQSSIEAPVEVLVEQPKTSWLNVQIAPQRLVIAGAVLLAGIALGAVLWLSGRRGWFSSAERRRLSKMAKDPVTQPVKIQQDQPRKAVRPASAEHPSWPRPATNLKSPAWLLRVDENNQPISGATIPITRREITIGSNPQQSSCVINVPAVEGLHARLLVSGDNYTLSDAGSIAGTWVNFSPVSSAGVRLEHGDLVHFGQVAFRFELASPGRVRKPHISKHEELL